MVNIAHPRGERPAGTGARPPREGGFAPPGGEARFQQPEPAADPSARSNDIRRARNFGPPAPPGGRSGDWDDKKKKKKGGGKGGGEGAAGGRRERGGGGQKWGSDPDDE